MNTLHQCNCFYSHCGTASHVSTLQLSCQTPHSVDNEPRSRSIKSLQIPSFSIATDTYKGARSDGIVVSLEKGLSVSAPLVLRDPLRTCDVFCSRESIPSHTMCQGLLEDEKGNINDYFTCPLEVLSMVSAPLAKASPRVTGLLQ